MLCELALHITASLISTEQDSVSVGIGRCVSNSFKFSLSFRFQAEAPNSLPPTPHSYPPPLHTIFLCIRPYQQDIVSISPPLFKLQNLFTNTDQTHGYIFCKENLKLI